MNLLDEKKIIPSREVIQLRKGDKRYARYDQQGHFTDNQDR
jgi:hypothetical protein